MLDRIEFRKRFLNRVLYLMFSRVQIVSGISSQYSDDGEQHRILWDLDECTLDDACDSLMKVQEWYDLGNIEIISDKKGSYGAVCHTIVSFKELLHILIDTELVDQLYLEYVFREHEAVLRLSDKENRPIHRETVCKLYRKSDRQWDEKKYYISKYPTGYISDKEGLRKGDFNKERTMKEVKNVGFTTF
jgi:hypothetical protein